MEFNATFLVAAVSFIAFTLIMQAIFYHPISEIIAKRKFYLETNATQTKENLNNAKVIRDERDKELLITKTEAKNLIMSEVEIAKQEKLNKEVALKNHLSQKVAEQKADLNKEKEETSSEMKAKLDEISSLIVSKLTGGEN